MPGYFVDTDPTCEVCGDTLANHYLLCKQDAPLSTTVLSLRRALAIAVEGLGDISGYDSPDFSDPEGRSADKARETLTLIRKEVPDA